MAYVQGNPKTKKQLKDMVQNGQRPEVFQPGPFGPEVKDGTVYLEGPHYPEPHKWYAQGVVENGRLVKVK